MHIRSRDIQLLGYIIIIVSVLCYTFSSVLASHWPTVGDLILVKVVILWMSQQIVVIDSLCRGKSQNLILSIIQCVALLVYYI